LPGTSYVKKLGRFLDLVMLVSFMGMSVCVLLQVIFRYVLRVSVPWTEELARYFCVWMVFIGAAVAMWRKEHLEVPLVHKMVPPKMRALLLIFVNLIVLLFLLGLLRGGISLVPLSWEVRAVTMPSVRVAYLYLALICGTVVMILGALRNIRGGAHELSTSQETLRNSQERG
jgi:TRAP-type C4-dicarboxylate transport system permease small subunit